MSSKLATFSTAMVESILAGTKTQTRRIVPVDPDLVDGHSPETFDISWSASHEPTGARRVRNRYGLPGGRIWVREAWRTYEHPITSIDGIRYRAGDVFVPIRNSRAAADRWIEAHDNGRYGSSWRTPRFMPAWASRISLAVQAIRVERLQDIDELGALAEGCIGRAVDGVLNGVPGKYVVGAARDEFVGRWDEINGDRGSWASNPYVWVVEFSVAEVLERLR